jgi:esterase/lipase superfamily enzyme
VEQDRYSAFPRDIGRLLEAGLINEEQVAAAKACHRSDAKGIVHHLVKLGHVSEEALLEVLAQTWKLPVLEKEKLRIDHELLRKFHPRFLESWKAMPLHAVGHNLVVAVVDPTAVMEIDELKYATGYSIALYLVGPLTFEEIRKQVKEFEQPPVLSIPELIDTPSASAPPIVAPGPAMRPARQPAAAAEVIPQENHTLVPVYFSTDRARGSQRATSFEEYFCGARCTDSELIFGRCVVSVPTDHRIGRVERPSWLRLQFREDPQKHIVITEIVEYASATFYEEIRDYVAADRDGGILVFVHGYNVAFADAVRRTAQISYDLSWKGPTICFSWPSEASIKAYLTDENNSRWAVPHFEQFMRELIARTKARIDVIAHSMGSRVLSEGLPGVVGHESLNEEMFPVRQVIFAAPDIDADVFRELVGKYRRKTVCVTMYASSNDEALKLSKSLHGGYTRAGETTTGILLVHGVLSIDASAVNTGLLGHSYYGDNRSIISDMHALLRGRTDPGSRFGMQPRFLAGGGPYWAFRP